MALRRRSPFGLLRDLERQLEDRIRGQEDGDDQNSITSWSPKVDVYEEDSNIVFEVEAPGVDKDDIDISIEDNRLTIKGERREASESEEDRDYYRSERFYGTFQRSFTLPDKVDTEDVSARYDNGLLHVTLPKRTRSTSTTIEIE
jgi:HSP20 family protein